MIRAEARAKLRRISEPLLWAVLTLVLTAVVLRVWATAHWLVLILPLLLLAASFTGFWIAVTKVRVAPRGDVEGIVQIDERRIGFLGPQDGGFVDLDALLRLELRGRFGARDWILYHSDGPPLRISQNAPGAGELLDAFTVLDGVGLAQCAAALNDPDEDIQLLWSRTTPATRTYLH